MLGFVSRRLLATIPVMAVVAVFVFLLLHLSPGDPATVIAGDYASPEDIARIRAKLGLDQPIHVQFLTWIERLVTGDLGISIFSNLPVATLIGQRLEPTLALALVTLTLAILIAVPVGTLAAWKAGSWIDRFVMGFAVLGFSVPVFVLGYALIWLMAIKLAWFPVQGYAPLAEGFWPFL
ncbi:MAG: ABC transporter permease, partial [Alphaproteobacteria bacterium]|nr:ABC transporter permease [Alphaproteobacteria bacterium]